MFNEASVKLLSYCWINSKRLGHFMKNSNKLYVGLTPTVLFDKAVNNISDEFLTPHYSLENPFIDEINASDT